MSPPKKSKSSKGKSSKAFYSKSKAPQHGKAVSSPIYYKGVGRPYQNPGFGSRYKGKGATKQWKGGSTLYYKPQSTGYGRGPSGISYYMSKATSSKRSKQKGYNKAGGVTSPSRSSSGTSASQYSRAQSQGVPKNNFFFYSGGATPKNRGIDVFVYGKHNK